RSPAPLPRTPQPPRGVNRLTAKRQKTITTTVQIAIQSSCISSPPTSSDVGSSPISASIGKLNVHLNGRGCGSGGAQSGIKASGRSRPDSSSSAVKKTSKTGPTRVVQNVTIPSDQS